MARPIIFDYAEGRMVQGEGTETPPIDQTALWNRLFPATQEV